MPDSLAAATVFALLIVPGYSFLAGYRLGRSHIRPERDLYAVAEAVIASIVILALAWLWVEDPLRWIDDGTLSEHSGGVVLLLLGLIGGPFAIGRMLAAAIAWAGDKKWTEPPLRFLGALDGNAWQEAWKRPREEGALVVIELASGETVYGQAADGTEIDFPPRPPAVFLPHAYRQEEGAPIRMEMGIYIPGEQIAAAYFAANDGSAVPTPARRLVPTEG